MSEEQKFPTEIVDLPSKGLLYPADSPLSSGKIELKYMTAKEEDILTSQNLIAQGVVIDKLLESLIVDKTIDVNDLLIGDKNAIMVAARILGYGKEYEFTYDGEEQLVDLSTLKEVKLDFSKREKGVNELHFKLPSTERELTFKLLNGKDERRIEEELTARKKVSQDYSAELTTRLKRMILTIDGNADRTYVNNFVDNEFLSRDSLAFRQYLATVTPDVDMSTSIEGKDGSEVSVTIPVTVRFFWPSASI